MSWSGHSQPHHTPALKQHPVHTPIELKPIEQTAMKVYGEQGLTGDQMKTPAGMQPKRGVVFFGSNKSKHLFPIYRDEEVGISGEFQHTLHPTTHDDDKMTTSTQLGLAIEQTC